MSPGATFEAAAKLSKKTPEQVQAAVHQLMQMGFERAKAQDALVRYDFDVVRSASYLAD